MINYKHYVPVLRWKQAEWLALEDLDSEAKSFITPLIEFIPGKLETSDHATSKRNISKTCEDISQRWGKAPIFIDLLHCPSQAVRVLNEIKPLALKMQLNLIPVVSPRQSQHWRTAVSEFINVRNPSICVRLNINDVVKNDIKDKLNQLLGDLKVKPGMVSIVIDYGYISTQPKVTFSEVLFNLPYLKDWLTVSIIGGAFPKDLSGFRPGIHTHDRLDWGNWCEQVIQDGLSRLPAYGDYTIQHANYSEPPLRANFSASIRYAAKSHWVIMRGEGVFSDNSLGFAQYPAQAALLREHDDFLGRDYSAGDRYIDTLGAQTAQKGNAGSWLRAGINHHITLVVNELANFDEI